MKIRLVLIIFAERKSFVAYHVWKHLAGYVELMDVMLEHEPEIWVKIADRKVLLKLSGDPLSIDMDAATYDLKTELAIDDPDSKGYLTMEEVAKLIARDPQNWEIEEIPK